MTDDQKAPSASLAQGCDRNHPHEDMSPLCEAKTIKARLESLHRRYCQAPEYTQGICDDGAAILEDGRMLTIEEILDRLRHPPGFPVPATLEETTPDERMREIALSIADESSASLLQCHLLTQGDGWLDTWSADSADDPAIKEAVEYLDLRGLLERHPVEHRLVRVIEHQTDRKPIFKARDDHMELRKRVWGGLIDKAEQDKRIQALEAALRTTRWHVEGIFGASHPVIVEIDKALGSP